jgi:protein involved in temperature-dependent protein secretion
MAKHSVELSTLIQDLDTIALKGGISAPLALKASRLAKLARSQLPGLGSVAPRELIAALLQLASLEDGGLGQAVWQYRNTRAWELRKALGEETAEAGEWLIDVPGKGQRY